MPLASEMRWAVCWVVQKRGKPAVVHKDFDDDFVGAQQLHDLAKRAGKTMATLVCKNVGFGPPEKYRPYVKVKKKKKIVNGKKMKVAVPKEVVPMAKVNGAGVFWCPYCREFRRFRRYLRYAGSDEYVLKCPICTIPHCNHHVRKWNPDARAMPESWSEREIKRIVHG